ncbi:outer membrane protein assembly factor BamC [Serratia sp. M24T3]|uniref:outer membrane protein assembly factor BamC n=1 Tax=Serratia sp. M24T3 TaxID=932213 RepID=UPI00025BC3AC|nr:outer membrane protein assembly factor BamC [Serratia sp. M24T3]EIC83007.1 lipoprotein [Serratia sp. M24T3]
MTYSLTKPRFQKSTLAKVMGLSLIMLLAACSNDSHYKREVNGNEDYLQAAPLKELQTPSGMILPLENGTYDVPPGTSKGALGKALDIRPPLQPLALVDGSRAQYTADTGTVLLTQSSGLWANVVTIVQKNGYKIASRDDANQTLTTDMVQWNRKDEDFQYQGRYQISVTTQGYQNALTVKTLELQQKGVAVTSPTEQQRYTGQMLNSITAGLGQLQQEQQNRLDNRKLGEIDVQSGADDTGLPVVIIRAPYGNVWERLPAALAKAGMKVTDSSRPQGTLTAKYSPLDSDAWDALGAKDPDLSSGEYKLQLGDLNNRSSLQFIDPKGHVLSQSQNDAMVAVMQAALNQSGTVSK